MGLNVKFIKNGETLGYCIGKSEGDHLSFPIPLLKHLIGNIEQLKGSELVIIDTKDVIKVNRFDVYEEDKTVAIDCSLIERNSIMIPPSLEEKSSWSKLFKLW